MKKKIKVVTSAVTLLAIMAFFSGCGAEENVGYVDKAKVMTTSAKAKEMQDKFEAKSIEIRQRLEEAHSTKTPEEFAKMQQSAQEEMGIYQGALQREFESYIESNLAGIAKEKNLGIIVDKGAIPSGGVDVTETLLEKMGKAPEAEKKEEDKK